MKTAAFLDRDGTLIEDVHFLADAARMRLMPGASDAVRTLNARGVLAIVITNQSGIARGLITMAAYDATRRRLEELLASERARVDDQYYCPHYPDISGPCGCRKPGTDLYRRAAAEHAISLEGSLYVGNRQRDVEPSIVLGGLGILVPSPATPEDEIAWADAHATLAPSLLDAVQRYIEWSAPDA